MNRSFIHRCTPRAMLSILALTLIAGLLTPPGVLAYDQYSGGASGGCDDCHGDFRASSYTSLVDGQNWGNLHNLHRQTMLSGDCDTCHKNSPSKFPVFTGSSDGGTGFPAFGCAGCHGRQEDAIDPGGDSVGSAAGLRQHHWNSVVTICADCHSDANPLNFDPSGEHVLPAYYFSPDANHTSKPTDPCNPAGEEQYAGLTIGLDNDGDDLFDGNDPDCFDTDSDTIVDGADPCIFFDNSGVGGLDDANGDGIPNVCQCGDANNNNGVDNNDLTTIFTCISTGNPPPCPANLAAGKAEGNGNLAFDNNDLTTIFGVISSAAADNYLLTCLNRPEGTPVP